MTGLITLYDIPTNVPNTPFSPNTWKSRYCLNYKGLPYKTAWVEYPDIESVCKNIGAKPTSTKKDGSPHYTLPVIHDPATNSVVSDSTLIAEYLDATYPSTPVLFPPGTRALQCGFQSAFLNALTPMYGALLCAAHTCLNPVSQEYFRRTKEARSGTKLEEMSPVGPKRDGDMKLFKENMDVVHGWFERNGGKMFVMGDTVCYVDLVVVSYLVWMKIVMGEDSKEWRDVGNWHGGRWNALVDSMRKYALIL